MRRRIGQSTLLIIARNARNAHAASINVSLYPSKQDQSLPIPHTATVTLEISAAYQKRKPIEGKNQRVSAPQNKYDPQQIIPKSQYREDYPKKKNKSGLYSKGEAMPNNLKLGGPSFNSTTYNQSFTPKNSVPPKQIKNPENLSNSQMRMNTASSYQGAYKWNNRKPPARQQPIIRSNNLKTEPQPFTGTSSYAHDFTVQVITKKQWHYLK